MDTAESALPQATLPGAVAVDHLASTVADLEAADGEDPIADATGDWMARKLGVPAEASARIVMIRLGKRPNFEVFESTCPGASRTAPQLGTPGSSCLLLAVADLPAFAARMRLAGLVVEDDERRLLRCRTEFGLTFEVVEDRAVDPRLPVDVVGMRYTVADLPAAQRFLTSVIGMGAVRGNAHRLGNGPLVELARQPCRAFRRWRKRSTRSRRGGWPSSCSLSPRVSRWPTSRAARPTSPRPPPARRSTRCCGHGCSSR
jgi:hypothetical protein